VKETVLSEAYKETEDPEFRATLECYLEEHKSDWPANKQWTIERRRTQDTVSFVNG
jgi:hypothetical protein